MSATRCPVLAAPRVAASHRLSRLRQRRLVVFVLPFHGLFLWHFGCEPSASLAADGARPAPHRAVI